MDAPAPRSYESLFGTGRQLLCVRRCDQCPEISYRLLSGHCLSPRREMRRRVEYVGPAGEGAFAVDAIRKDLRTCRRRNRRPQCRKERRRLTAF
jgi:hypothetical protein